MSRLIWVVSKLVFGGVIFLPEAFCWRERLEARAPGSAKACVRAGVPWALEMRHRGASRPVASLVRAESEIQSGLVLEEQ